MSRELLKQRVEEMKNNVTEFKNYQSEFKYKLNDKSKFNSCKENFKGWLNKPIINNEHKEKVKKFGLSKNKKGAMAFEWFYALIFLFALGVFFVIYNQILTNDILPLSHNLVPDDFAGKADIELDNNTWMTYWQAIPFVLFAIVLLYLFIQSIIKKEY